MKRVILAILLIALVVPSFGAVNYFRNTASEGNTLYLGGKANVLSGGTLTVASGGTLTLASGSTFNYSGAFTAATSLSVGGGYGSTGATISTAGVGQFNGALSTDGALTADNIVCTNAATFGGGYASTGCTISTAGVGQFAGALTTDGAFTGLSAAIGGGYGSTGATISDAGVIQANGAITTDGAITAATGTIKAQTVVSEATNTRVCTSADYGKLIIVSTTDAVGITLPANGAAAGSMIDFLVTAENAGTVTISPATADTLITANSADSDAVTFASGHRIGAYVRCISDGAVWAAINLGQTTMGVTDTD